MPWAPQCATTMVMMAGANVVNVVCPVLASIVIDWIDWIERQVLCGVQSGQRSVQDVRFAARKSNVNQRVFFNYFFILNAIFASGAFLITNNSSPKWTRIAYFDSSLANVCVDWQIQWCEEFFVKIVISTHYEFQICYAQKVRCESAINRGDNIVCSLSTNCKLPCFLFYSMLSSFIHLNQRFCKVFIPSVK